MCRPPDEKLPWLGISRVSAQRVACSKRFRLLHLAARVLYGRALLIRTALQPFGNYRCYQPPHCRRGPVAHAGPQFEVFQGMRGRLREWRDRVWPCVLYTVNGKHSCALITSSGACSTRLLVASGSERNAHETNSLVYYSFTVWGRVSVCMSQCVSVGCGDGSKNTRVAVREKRWAPRWRRETLEACCEKTR